MAGARVRVLQQRLTALGYWLDKVDGVFDAGTAEAVVALQKASGLDRDGVVGPRTAAALAAGVRPRPAPGVVSGVEVDLSDQLLLVIDQGRVRWVLDASTGSGRAYVVGGRTRIAVTPVGNYRVLRLVEGWDRSPLGQLWRPAYFVGGVAIHGYPVVPPYPASHGCVRVSIEAMDFLLATGLVGVGTPVVVRS